MPADGQFLNAPRPSAIVAPKQRQGCCLGRPARLRGKRDALVMDNEAPRYARPGKRLQGGSELSAQQTVVAWATVLLGAVFMAAGGVAILLSLS
jgi:hypothetical protein